MKTKRELARARVAAGFEANTDCDQNSPVVARCDQVTEDIEKVVTEGQTISAQAEVTI